METALGERLPAPQTEPARLHEAMRYASLAGGKRIRAILVYAAGQAVGARLSALDAPACAVELIHAYSLVHDDLPAMDNDTLRRGKPTCHIAYDEATAILVGDGLQSLAFELLADHVAEETSAATRLKMISTLARAAGSSGMVGGQARDMSAVGRRLSVEQLQDLHLGKTGALIRASVRLGALCNASTELSTLERLDTYAAKIGLAFQIVDDILDEEADTETLGKISGVDRALDKATYPSILGLAESKQLAHKLHLQAIGTLDKMEADTNILRQIAEMIVAREY